MPKKSLEVLINSGGGTVKSAGVEAQCAAIVKSFARHGIDAHVRAVEGEEMAEAVQAGDGPAIVGGGDGTLAAAAGVLARSGRPLGVLPLGTLNHFAKDLGVPTLDAAVDAIAAGHVRQVDVGDLCGHVFINNSSIGFYPHMVAERTREQEASGLPKWAAMLVASVRTLKRFPRHRLAIRLEGQDRPIVTPCLFVGNNNYELAGLQTGKRRRLDGGGLFVVIVEGRSIWNLIGVTLKAALGRTEQAEDIDVVSGVTHMTIDSHASHLHASMDGEVRRLRTPLDYRIRPGALSVYAPKAA